MTQVNTLRHAAATPEVISTSRALPTSCGHRRTSHMNAAGANNRHGSYSPVMDLTDLTHHSERGKILPTNVEAVEKIQRGRSALELVAVSEHGVVDQRTHRDHGHQPRPRPLSPVAPNRLLWGGIRPFDTTSESDNHSPDTGHNSGSWHKAKSHRGVSS